MQLSRKHVIETGPEGRVSIFGGKLTDCLNVGDELCAEVVRLGVALPEPGRRWYGEPPAEAREAFLAEARAMGLDGRAGPEAVEPISTRLWRRYGAEAPGLLEAIRRDGRAAETILQCGDYLRCELEHAARREMVVGLEDFLRRRTELAQVVRREALRGDPGLPEACRVLFGTAAEAKRAAYLGESRPA
jgi:glycerol-3-phosphate dehydrogenase